MVVVVGGGVHLFSVSVVSAALALVERASSALTHLVRAREAATLNPDPLDPAASWELSPERG